MSVPLSELERRAQSMAQTIDAVLNPPLTKLPLGSPLRLAMKGPRRIGFVLWLFDFGQSGFATYVSNAEREDMIKALKEMLERLESSQPTPPGDIPP